MADDVFGYIAEADAFIAILKGISGAEQLNAVLFNRDNTFISTVKEIRDLGNIVQYERLLDEVGEIFKPYRSKPIVSPMLIYQI